MVYLKKRQLKIIEFLFLKNKKITYDELSELFSVSKRTIRNDMILIEQFLEEKHVVLHKDAQGQFFIDDAQKAIGNQFDEVLSGDAVYILTQQERQHLLILALIKAGAPMTISELSDLLEVSYSTTVNDIKNIGEVTSRLGLELVRKQNYGLNIKGSEKNIRKAVVKIILDNVDNTYLMGILCDNGMMAPNKFIALYFDVSMLIEIKCFLHTISDTFECRFSDNDHILLTLDIATQITRIKQNRTLEACTSADLSLSNRVQHLMATKLASLLEGFYQVHFSPAEIYALTVMLSGVYYIKYKGSREKNTFAIASALNTSVANDIITTIIKKFEGMYGETLSTNRHLFLLICEHLRTTLFRMEHDLILYNPLQELLIEEHKNIYDIVSLISDDVAQQYGYDYLPEEELGYITIYIAAALEEYAGEAKVKPKALVVCGISHILIEYLEIKLRTHFKDLDIVGPIPMSDIDEGLFDTMKINMVISTSPIKFDDRVVCLISPLLTNEDIAAIEETIAKVTSNHMTKAKGESEKMLKDVLKKSSMKLQVEATDWEDAVRKVGRLMVDDGNVKEQYIDNMVQTVKELGPYIVLAPGIALAHSRPDESVINISMAMISLKNPVEFGNEYNDPVKLVFALAGKDHESHVDAMSQWAAAMQNEENVKRLMETTDLDEAYTLLMGE